mgnify:FL=1|tara:strand:+ start:78 stop:530 length:453 start_codon:yes stop_codon:yes gene_type:complete
MKKMILTLALGLLIAVGANAQEVQAECHTSDKGVNAKGDWYVGTGNIANVSWTEWSLNPTVGYAITDDLMVGLGVSQLSSEDLAIDVHARYFYKEYFAYAATAGLNVDDIKLGVGRMFNLHGGGIFLDPKVVYDFTAKTTNLELGFGLKF